ncbi:MAG TPA: hypothetical protein PKI11_20460, partial [Candidatus Hydrogenedentes bacterium]|nr:hypothetical protein [Candidatus Hydrogenedentota bacterium]
MAQDERHRRRAAFTTVSMAALAACSPVASADTSRIWDVDASAGVNIARHWPMLLILGFLAVAILIEIVRRLRQRAAHLRQQWRAVRKLAEERELSRKEQELLESLVRRYAARAPFEAVSGYRDFDACVARDIEEQARSLDARAIEARGAALRELRVRLGLDYVPFGLQIRSTRELCVGQVLWAAREANAPQWHKMRVASVDEARFRADVAAEDTRPPFEAGETLRFRIWRDEDARYTFATRLVRIEERPAQWVLDHTHDLDRVQA